eukprot:4102516-Prymnesium_polylepis.1
MQTSRHVPSGPTRHGRHYPSTPPRRPKPGMRADEKESGRGVRAAVNVHDDVAHCIKGGSPEGLGEEVGH